MMEIQMIMMDARETVLKYNMDTNVLMVEEFVLKYVEME